MGTHVREREVFIRDFIMVEQGLLRRRMEAAIDSMLALLDELDGDPNLEPDNDDEASLGWEDGCPTRFNGGSTPGTADCECDIGDDFEGGDEDREYTSLERHGNGFVYSGPDDLENGHDAEWDMAEAGIADRDGLIEQCGSGGVAI